MSSPVLSDLASKTNEVDRIGLLFLTDLTTIDHLICGRQRLVLRKNSFTAPKSGSKQIGLINASTDELMAVMRIVKCNGPISSDSEELRQKKILGGLCISSIDEIKATLNRWKQCYLWEIEIFGVIDRRHSIVLRHWQKSDGAVFAAEDKLGTQFAHTRSVYTPYAKLVPLSRDLPEFMINSSPFVVGRDKYQSHAVWKHTGKLGISRKHCTFIHDWGRNMVYLRRDSDTNDMAVNSQIVDLKQTTQVQCGDIIAFNSALKFRIEFLQTTKWNSEPPDWLDLKQHRSSAMMTPPVSTTSEDRRMKRKKKQQQQQQQNQQQQRDKKKMSRQRPIVSHESPVPSAHRHRSSRGSVIRKLGMQRTKITDVIIDLTQEESAEEKDGSETVRRNNQTLLLLQNKKKRSLREMTETDDRTNMGGISDNKYDIVKLSDWKWYQIKSLVFARYQLNPELRYPTGLELNKLALPSGGLLLIRTKACSAKIVYPKQIGSLLTRHAYLQSILEGLIILGGAKCTLHIDYMDDSSVLSQSRVGSVNGSTNDKMIMNEIRIGNIGNGFPLIILLVCDITHLYGVALNRLLIKLEELDILLYEKNHIHLPFLYGIITDGNGQWLFIQRSNEYRYIAKDILNDPLLSHNQHFNLAEQFECYDQGKMSAVHRQMFHPKLIEICDTLAVERHCLHSAKKFKDSTSSVTGSLLYSGMDLLISRKSAYDLQKLSEILFGLLNEQCNDFQKSFNQALKLNPSSLSRPAMNPYHESNRKERKRQLREYLQLQNQLVDATDDFQNSFGEHNAW